MQTPLVLVIALALAGPAHPLAQPAEPVQNASQEKKAAPSIAGAWKMPVESPHGKMEIRFDLVVDAKDPRKITGLLSLGHGEPANVAGEFVQGKLTFKTIGAPMELSFTGTLKDADTLPGFLSSQNGDLQGVATRIKPAK